MSENDEIAYAQVKFLDDGHVQILPIGKIKEFRVKKPKHEKDFGKKDIYTGYWYDEKNKKELQLAIQISKLGSAKDLEKWQSKRACFTKINVSAVDRYYTNAHLSLKENSIDNFKKDVKQKNKEMASKALAKDKKLQQQIFNKKMETFLNSKTLEVDEIPSSVNTNERQVFQDMTIQNLVNENAVLKEKCNNYETTVISIKLANDELKKKLETLQTLNMNLQSHFFTINKETEKKDCTSTVKLTKENESSNKNVNRHTLNLSNDTKYSYSPISSPDQKDKRSSFNAPETCKNAISDSSFQEELRELDFLLKNSFDRSQIKMTESCEKYSNKLNESMNASLEISFGPITSTPKGRQSDGHESPSLLLNKMNSVEPNYEESNALHSASDESVHVEKKSPSLLNKIKTKKPKRVFSSVDCETDEPPTTVKKIKYSQPEKKSKPSVNTCDSKDIGIDGQLKPNNNDVTETVKSKHTKTDETKSQSKGKKSNKVCEPQAGCSHWEDKTINKNKKDQSKAKKNQSDENNTLEDENEREKFLGKFTEIHDGHTIRMRNLGSGIQLEEETWMRLLSYKTASKFTKNLLRQFYSRDQLAVRSVKGDAKSLTPNRRNPRQLLTPEKSKLIGKCLKYYVAKKMRITDKQRLEKEVARKNHYIYEEINDIIKSIRNSKRREEDLNPDKSEDKDSKSNKADDDRSDEEGSSETD